MGIGGPPTHLPIGRFDHQTGSPGRNEEGRDLVGPGLGRDGDQRGDLGPRVGDERLGAVDHPLVAIEHGLGAGPSRIRTGIRFGQAECSQSASGCQVGEPLTLLLLGAEAVDRIGAQTHACLEGDGDGGVDPGQFLDGDAQA